MSYRVIFSPEAAEQLAARYAEAIVSYCAKWASSPIRGIMRDDVRPGLRITNYKKRTAIAFAVDAETEQVSIIGLFYGGQDYKTILQKDHDS